MKAKTRNNSFKSAHPQNPPLYILTNTTSITLPALPPANPLPCIVDKLHTVITAANHYHIPLHHPHLMKNPHRVLDSPTLVPLVLNCHTTIQLVVDHHIPSPAAADVDLRVGVQEVERQQLLLHVGREFLRKQVHRLQHHNMVQVPHHYAVVIVQHIHNRLPFLQQFSTVLIQLDQYRTILPNPKLVHLHHPIIIPNAQVLHILGVSQMAEGSDNLMTCMQDFVAFLVDQAPTFKVQLNYCVFISLHEQGQAALIPHSCCYRVFPRVD